MLLLANENLPISVIQALRERGHDVLAIRETMAGATDEAVLALAQAEGRLVLTQDKDFGELAFRSRLPANSGIILFRLSGTDPDSDCARIIQAIDERADWTGQFAVVTGDRVRMRPLP